MAAIALATLGPGDIFGELAMLNGSVVGVSRPTDAELLALPAGDVRRLLADHPDISVKLIAALTRRLRETNERVARQSFQTVPSRVAGVLTQLIAEESAAEGRHGITIRMTQADLAQLAGTSRESVSRFLAMLERAGVVQVGRGRVTVVEPRRLARLHLLAVGRLPDADEFASQRANMVERQLRRRGIGDQRVVEATAAIPR